MLTVIGSSVAVPLLAVLAVALIKAAAANTFEPRAIVNSLSVDLCVLGIGLSGATMAIPLVQRMFGGPTGAVVWTSCLLLAEIIFSGIIVLAQKYSKDDRLKLRISMALGFVSVAVPSTFIVLAYMTQVEVGAGS